MKIVISQTQWPVTSLSDVTFEIEEESSDVDE